jgi:LPS-assembly lipoprotein
MSCCDGHRWRAGIRRVAPILLLALAACGFHPLYSTRTYDVAPELASIKVASIADRRGQELRNLLYTDLNPKGVPARPVYVLDTTLSVAKQDLAIAKDETVTRANLIIVARYIMRAIETGHVLFRGESSSTTSFDVVRSEYANIAAEQDAQSRALKAISGDMTLRLSFYFTRGNKDAARAASTNAPVAGAPPTTAPPATSPSGYVPPSYAPQGYGPQGYAPPSYTPQTYAPPPYVPPPYVPPASVPSAYAPPPVGQPAYDPPAAVPAK